MPALRKHDAEHGGIEGYQGADSVNRDDVLLVDCDILIPAALGDAITKDNMKDVRAEIIVEGANGPVSSDADAYLNKHGKIVLPDIYANAGGVTVSHLEWVQNIQQFQWTEEQVNASLQTTMSRAFHDLMAYREKYKTDFRTAAFALALDRVHSATLQRGLL